MEYIRKLYNLRYLYRATRGAERRDDGINLIERNQNRGTGKVCEFLDFLPISPELSGCFTALTISRAYDAAPRFSTSPAICPFDAQERRSLIQYLNQDRLIRSLEPA